MSETSPRRTLSRSLREASKAVLCIAGCGTLLMCWSVPSCGHLLVTQFSKPRRVQMDLQALERALVQYTEREGQLPREGDWLLLVDAGDLEQEPEDAWGRVFTFTVAEDGKAEVSSLGADGLPGGEGDDADLVRRFKLATPSR